MCVCIYVIPNRDIVFSTVIVGALWDRSLYAFSKCSIKTPFCVLEKYSQMF